MQDKKTASGWLLSNQSATINCAINDVLLRYGQWHAIQSGDYIELGLLRLVVADDCDAENTAELMTVSAPWRDDDGGVLHEKNLNPFADLPRFTPEMQAQTSAERTLEKTDVITQLAWQFRQAVTDPTFLQRGQASTGASQVTDQVTTTLEQLARQDPAHFSLEDVLSGQLSIDQVLHRIGPDDPAWNTPAAPENVLLLFADEMARQEPSPLPGLTRREHHAISPDSPVSIGATNPITTAMTTAFPQQPEMVKNSDVRS